MSAGQNRRVGNPLSSLPASISDEPSPRTLLDRICSGAAEPQPKDFLLNHETHEKHENRMERLYPRIGANARDSDSPQGTEGTKCSLRPLRPSVKSGSKLSPKGRIKLWYQWSDIGSSALAIMLYRQRVEPRAQTVSLLALGGARYRSAQSTISIRDPSLAEFHPKRDVRCRLERGVGATSTQTTTCHPPFSLRTEFSPQKS